MIEKNKNDIVKNMENQQDKIAVIIGAGPAGLTAAYELLHQTKNIKPLIYEASEYVGGIAKTINYKGNRIDMGGHRFFSKSDAIMQWWQNILPLENAKTDTEKTDKVMLIRQRLSRIFFLGKFFDYPVSLNFNTISNLGLIRFARIVLSYLKIKISPIKKERSLEDFFINRFGKELYLTFFKDYTEKLWGVSCSKIQPGDYFLSSMPVKDLIENLEPKAPLKVLETAQGLAYRDFATIGLLLKKLKIKDGIKDTWIYIQERNVKIGRLQIFNNWSPYLVKNPNNVWLGLEYFGNEGDELWQKSDAEFIDFAIKELVKIGMIEQKDILDKVLIKTAKAYPAYFGAYSNFEVIRKFTDAIENLFLIGRNGMHRYNNQDHSMLTAMAAVENIISKKNSKDNIWNINAEQEYHEGK